ncbi:MAG: CPBP family intramembrane metalloprotease [Ruminococcus sp.]|uniref:CPBP family intramembrane glutamic endopeptidase n=1 Tax=Ruminococcus sp. TaxID=41978 RepID=UPI0025D62868|nr:CPBP family intramembrane glutamic endopeptidase [Ruminococcus sp.]MCR4795856.1 CPBP family intramembrane metalloprotease [Ruminococcus sp.]
MFDYRPKMFDEASHTHTSKKLTAILLAFIVVFGVIFLLESIIPSIITTKPMLEEMRKQGYLDNTEKFNLTESMKIATKVSAVPKVMIPSLLSTIFGTIGAIFYCRCVEMRPVRSMGARKKGLITHYLIGLLIGIAMMSAITLLSVAFGANSIKLCDSIDYKILALFLLGFFVQGMSEEFIFRGYLMNSIGGGGHHTAIAVGISAAAFALAHAANPGFGVVPFINLALFGVFAAFYMMLFDNIWGVCAIHSIWNFTQGNIYGISVSGSGDTESLFRTTQISDKAFLTGGEFGIEGSIFTTLILSIGVALTAFALYRKTQNSEPAPKT